MNVSNITSDLKPTSQTAPFRLAIGALVGALVLPILLPMVCNALLPATDAAVSKQWYFDSFGAALPVILGGGSLGAVAGSLFKTGGKVVAQLSPGVVTEATPAGEGISLANAALSGNKDVLKSAAIDLATDQIAARTGVDVSGVLHYVDATPPGEPVESE